MVLSIQTSDLVDWMCCWYIRTIRLSLLAISRDSTDVCTINVDRASCYLKVEVTKKGNSDVLVQIDA